MMRKSLIAVAIGAALTVAACSDKEAAQQTSETAQQEQMQTSGSEFNASNPFYTASTLPYQAP
ncbi:hypothetical protein C9939_05060, partial [Pseudidiomarina aestuarii]